MQHHRVYLCLLNTYITHWSACNDLHIGNFQTITQPISLLRPCRESDQKQCQYIDHSAHHHFQQKSPTITPAVKLSNNSPSFE